MPGKRIRLIATVSVLVALVGVGWFIWQLPQVQMARWSRASLPELEQTVAADPNDWRTQYWFGKRTAEVGDFTRAEPALRAAFGTTPSFLPAATELGKVLLAQGKVEEAYQVLRMVVGRDPGQKDAQLSLAQLYRLQQAHPRAQEILTQLAQSDPKNVTVLFELAAAQVGMQQPDAAEKTLRAALALDGKNVMVLTALSRLRRERGDVAQAETFSRQAVAAAPSDLLAKLELARVLAKKPPVDVHRKEALDVLKQARELAPDHAGVLLEAGRLLVAEDRLEEAVAALTTVLRLDPRATPAYYLLGEANNRLGRRAEGARARALFQRRQAFDKQLAELSADLANQPESADLRFRIGDLYAADGQVGQAVQYYRIGLQRDPENSKARARLADLLRRNLERSGGDAASP